MESKSVQRRKDIQMSDKPREWWASHLSMNDSEGGARDWTPKSEWTDLRCYVEKSAYEALQVEHKELQASFDFLDKANDQMIETKKALQAIIDDLKEMGNKKFDEIQRLQAENEELKKLHEQATRFVLPGEVDTSDAYLKILNDLRADLQTAQAVINYESPTQRENELQAELKRMSEVAYDYGEEITALKVELEAARSAPLFTALAYQDEIAATRADRDLLDNSNIELNHQLTALKAENEKLKEERDFFDDRAVKLLDECSAYKDMCEKLGDAHDKISKFFITNDSGRFGSFIGAGAVDISKEALTAYEAFKKERE